MLILCDEKLQIIKNKKRKYKNQINKTQNIKPKTTKQRKNK